MGWCWCWWWPLGLWYQPQSQFLSSGLWTLVWDLGLELGLDKNNKFIGIVNENFEINSVIKLIYRQA